VVPGILVVNKR